MSFAGRGVDTLVDSSVWIDFFNGARTPQVDLLDRLLGQQAVVVGDVILAEVLQGFRRDRDVRLARAALLRFPVVDMVGKDVALASALAYRQLRARGVTIRRVLDCLIATYCIQARLQLLHADRDFDPFERHFGLRVLHD
jgi:predicted nucleic acid-binding protein